MALIFDDVVVRVDVVDELAVVKHFVLKLFPIHTTITFELKFEDDVCDKELSVLCERERERHKRKLN